MLHLIQKSHLPDFLNKQFIPLFCLFVFACLLTYKKYSPVYTAVCILVLFNYSYFIHIAFHHFPDIINLHVNHHHNVEENKSIINKILNILLETGTNIIFFLIFYYFQKIMNLHLVPNIIIFYYGFIYVTTHNINYSIYHTAEQHVLHHKTTDNAAVKTCNYGPDLADHIYNTNYYKNTFENYIHIIPNILMSFLISYYLYKPELF
jgi:sterol desaturase/sphingolipid hydroxylase (fatty acid hydroxylase superfamily)